MSTVNSTSSLGLDPAQAEEPEAATVKRSGWRRRLLWGGAALGVAATLAAGYLVSREPTLFNPMDAVYERLPEGSESTPQGAALTATAIEIAETLTSKRGGFLSNDVAPPFAVLDNMPSWEYGVLTELRDTVRSMRNDFGRAQSQSAEDSDLMIADAQFHFSPTSWMLPSSEDEYRVGIAALNRYLDRLLGSGVGSARFHARADNLNFYLATVEKRLGNLSQRLSASARLPSLHSSNTVASDEETVVPDGTAIGNTEVSWRDADNVFYEARGYIWALVHTLRALEQDFAPLLQAKQATMPMHEIILKLELAQQRIWSPVILTSSGFGVLTNHSLVLASYISRANAAIIDFRTLISEG